MREIGGYLNLELSNYGSFPHADGVLVNSGSNALEYALHTLADVRCIWLPYFTCHILLKPLNNMGVAYKFYHINERLELADHIQLGDGEYLLVTNYYGIKDAYIERLTGIYGNRMIIDNAQAFYANPLENICTIYSPRKFLGIPDGGIACGVDRNQADSMTTDTSSFRRFSHLIKRYDLGADAAYEDFKANDMALAESRMERMSCLTKSLLYSVNHEKVKRVRNTNFSQLDKELQAHNQLCFDRNGYECPLVYPFLTPDGMELKKYLIANKIYCATYWPNVFDWCKQEDVEYKLAKNVVCLPIDQRYNEEDMKRIIKTIKNYES